MLPGAVATTVELKKKRGKSRRATRRYLLTGLLLFPLAHTASLRAAIPMDQVTRPVDPAALPSAVQVASGIQECDHLTA